MNLGAIAKQFSSLLDFTVLYSILTQIIYSLLETGKYIIHYL